MISNVHLKSNWEAAAGTEINCKLVNRFRSRLGTSPNPQAGHELSESRQWKAVEGLKCPVQLFISLILLNPQGHGGCSPAQAAAVEYAVDDNPFLRRVVKRRCSSSESTPATGIQSSSSSWFPPQYSSDLSDFTVDDYMLVEVLCRLPSIRSLLQCMCVCKAWYRIISSYYFVRRFISHRINNTLDDHGATDDDVLVNYQGNPFNMILAYTYTAIDAYAEPLPFRHHYKFLPSNQYLSLFQTLAYDFSFLPVEKNKRQGGFEIWAAYNDLILCSVGPRDCSFQRYLCNPFTKQWVALPPNAAAGVRAGLVCEPYCLEDTRGMYTLNKYKVVDVDVVSISLYLRRFYI
ncbi:hypothetical protein Tsubulata_042782 [Turnera subulata]|uniref:F-box domain-containing protein n=1 Tax=Turnera subulata TaxID=218843 RepID=A0A9Q0FZP3_9ROSI|nr:hypothetical protein Tsubulata_042782 [Turnera subulata]